MKLSFVFPDLMRADSLFETSDERSRRGILKYDFLPSCCFLSLLPFCSLLFTQQGLEPL